MGNNNLTCQRLHQVLLGVSLIVVLGAVASGCGGCSSASRPGWVHERAGAASVGQRGLDGNALENLLMSSRGHQGFPSESVSSTLPCRRPPGGARVARSIDRVSHSARLRAIAVDALLDDVRVGGHQAGNDREAEGPS